MSINLSSDEILELFDVFISFVEETCNSSMLDKYKKMIQDKLEDFKNKREIKAKEQEEFEKQMLEEIDRVREELNRMVSKKK